MFKLLRNPTPEPTVPPPAILSRWQIWMVFLLLLLIPFFLPIPHSLRYHPITSHFGDQLHIPLLGAIYLMIYWKGPLRGRIVPGALVAAAIGGAIEFLQILVGRGALLHDWYLDLQGIAVVLTFLVWRGYRLRLGLVGLILMLIFIPMQSLHIPGMVLATYECRGRFPVLDDFESSRTKTLWEDQYSSQLRFQPRSEDETDHLLSVVLPAKRSWPGARMHHFPGDWSDYTQFVFSARHRTVGVDTLRFGVRLDDWEGRLDGQWIADGFTATTEWQVFRMPLDGRKVRFGERIFDISDVIGLLFYLSSPPQDMILELDDLHLQ